MQLCAMVPMGLITLESQTLLPVIRRPRGILIPRGFITRRLDRKSILIRPTEFSDRKLMFSFSCSRRKHLSHGAPELIIKELLQEMGGKGI